MNNLPQEEFRCSIQILLSYSDVPASTKYHHAYAGGLLVHVCEMINSSILFDNSPSFPMRDFLWSILLHDAEKIRKYVQGPDGSWKYNSVERLDMNAVSESVLLASSLFHKNSIDPMEILTNHVMNAITYAHGGWSEGDTSKMTPIAHSLHVLDEYSAQFLDKAVCRCEEYSVETGVSLVNDLSF